ISVGDEITALPSGEKAAVKSVLMTDKEVQTAYAGQPVTISLDKEVDVSRGCVLIKGTDIGIFKRLKVSLLWMDDEELSVGKDYLVKLGTKTIPAILAGIDYAVDVNTGEHIKAEKLSKNGIAVCDILLTEAIAADKFTAHKTLGELILIDRVTNMTSACGVVLELSERGDTASEKASFKNGELSARGDIFEEFYYDTSSLNVLKYQPVKATYTVGDEIPTEGESYHYPDSFDIIVLRDGVSVKVRDKKITEIIPTADYSYGGVPVVNGRGFGVKASSDEEISRFLKEYSETDEKEQSGFFAKWVRFDEYRKVIVKS
ncbi:MAG: sulfate adenylyltransferase, partial [Ruminococcus sp.]|nr:sulfate adenylyltransferase [Ruminococcus sp.]